MNYMWQMVLSRPLTWESVIVYPENMYVMGCICVLGYIRGCDSFLPLHSVSGMPVICGTLCLNAYSIIKVFSCSPTFVKRILGLGEDFVFNYISPTGSNHSFPDGLLKINM